MASSQLTSRQLFVDYLYGNISQAILCWDDGIGVDIYMVWLRLTLLEDDARFVEIAAVSYGTNNHTTAELSQSYGSRWSPYCSAGGTNLNLCHPSDAELVAIYGIKDQHDVEGCQLRDAYLAEATAGLDQDSPETILNPILEACSEIISRLHSDGILESKCGHPVPVGIGFSNDVDSRFALKMTREANPTGLSRGIEEWMTGCTYEQVEAKTQLLDEVAAKSPSEQVAFWLDAILAEAEQLYLNRQTPLSKRLSEIGGLELDARLLATSTPEVATDAVPWLVSLIETMASAKLPSPYDPEARQKGLPCGDANDVALVLLTTLKRIGEVPVYREAVSDTEVERLFTLLEKLFHDGESLDKVGLTTGLVARALHALHPTRFPQEKLGAGGVTANRLLNYRDFGLSKKDLNTPDYDEAAEEARRAERRNRLRSF